VVGELTWPRRLLGLWVPLAALFVFALFPFAWMAATSLKANAETAKLKVGQTLVTDNSSRASITLDETGSIDVEPDSRLKVVASGPERKRLSLERGTIHATIWGPAGSFGVDTPSAVAVDLGCVFTLHVDDSGAGLVRTTMGWVGFKLNGHESFIPAGAVCATDRGPGARLGMVSSRG